MEDTVEIPKHTVIQYVRHKGGKKKNTPYGVVVGVKVDEGFRVGYSLCNKKDRFSKNMALKIAIGRVYQGNCVGDHSLSVFTGVTMSTAGQETAVPNEVRRMMPEFIRRCKHYYNVQ